MKTLILSALLSLMQSSLSFATDRNTVFFEGSLNSAREKAIQDNKLLIMVFKAKWCLPCRFMEKNVFLNQEVKDFSDKNAIIYQIDIDNNKNLKDEFQVEVLPTIIMMNDSGAILSRKEESLSAEAFMNWITKSIDTHSETTLTTTKAQVEDEPLQIEMPNLNTTDFEADFLKIHVDLLNNQNYSNPPININYYIQAGVFTNKANAENMIALLTMTFKEGTKIDEETNDTNKIYKVCIGSFNTKEEAVQFQHVLGKHKINAVVKHN